GLPNANIYTATPSSVGTHFYRVVVTDSLSGCSQPISNIVNVIVQPDASITVSPATTIVCIDGDAPLSAVLTGGSSQVSIQWETSSSLSGPWIDITGETSSIYSAPTGLQGTNYYRVRVNDNIVGCFEPYSTIMTVTAVPDLNVTAQPVSFAECIGGTLSLNVLVNGGYGTITYQWQSSVTGISESFTDISGATSSVYTPPSTTSGTTWYRVLINADGVGCDDILSNVASAVINPDISFAEQPVGFTGCVDAIQTLSVLGENGTGILTYQWQLSNSNTPFNWSDISGAQSTTYVPNTSSSGTIWYRVIISAAGNGCQDALSDIIEVIIVADPLVTITAAQTQICDGGVASFTSIVTGGTGLTQYQWQQEIGITWINIPGATFPNYTSPILTEGNYSFRLTITQGIGCSSVSNAIYIQVLSDPTITVTADLNEFCDGGSASLHSAVSGGAGTIVYQWQEFISETWVSITGATSQDYTSPALAAGIHFFRVLVTQNSGCETVSDQYIITVDQDPTVTIQSDANAICTGGLVHFTSIVTGGVGTTSYQWERFNSNTSLWEIIPGATSSTYTTPILNSLGTYEYRLSVTQGLACASVSSSIIITVVADPLVSIQTGTAFLCVGANTLLTSQVTGGAGTIIYQWQNLVVNVGFVNISGANSASYSTPVYTSPGTFTYRLLVTQNSGCQTVSGEIDIHVADDPVIVMTAEELIICDGGVASMSAVVTGGSGTSVYQWQLFSSTQTAWINIANANNPSYITDVLTPGTYEYRLVVTQNTGCETVGDELVIVVTPDIVITGQPQGGSICEGGFILLSVTASGPPNIQYQWQSSTNGTPESFVNISGATASTYTPPSSVVGTTYYRVLTYST
ncbi:MAG: hypothetical protein ABIT06_02450, partial [Saprospiraceae bacterium]